MIKQASSWISSHYKEVPHDFYLAEGLDILHKQCVYTIVALNIQYGFLNVCFNPSCSVRFHTSKKDVQNVQSAENNNLLRFLERDTLGIMDRNRHVSTVPILQKCSVCHLMQYCSKECQRKDWRRHKPFCTAVEELTISKENSI